MDKRVTQGSVWLTYTLCGVLTLQPALANVVIDGNSANTSKTQAGNGVEVINIATPNGKGLSHNKYQQFNVDPEGLILNNSTAQLSQSQLGGILQNNPNLKGKAANVILNEVTGANRSQLEGYTEVFGQQANVILANPYGITCDGCGFINTPRVTLSTGVPELTNGQLTGFDVSKGSVTIEGLGLDATKQTYFDIISRTAEINANIHANDLSVITGNNKVTYQSNQVTEKSSKPASKPALAIDSSSIGGMYAGRISLVATENGVGVNLGNLVSNVGDIVLTADGKVQLASAQSAKNIEITSSRNVELTNQQNAQEQLKISADSVALNQTMVTAGDLVEITVNESLSAQNSQLFSGVKNNNQTNANAELSIKAAQLTLQDSEIVSKGSLSSQIASLELDSKSTVVAKDIALTDVKTIENDGEINASATFEVDAEQLTLAGSGTVTADSIKIDVNSANLDSQITSNTLSVKAQSTLDIGQEANLQSTGNTTLNAQSLTQKGQLTSNGTITLDANTLAHQGETSANQIVVNSESLEQSGQLIAEQDISIIANDATLSGQTQAKQTLQVTGETINVTGTLEATQLDMTSTSSVNIDSTAQMSAIDQLSIDTSDLLNKGSSHSGGTLTIDAKTLEQQGTLTSVGDLHIDTTSLDIQSDIETQGNLNITASSVTNSAQAMAGQDLTLSAQSLSNSGTLTASGDTSVSLTSNLTHGSSGTISGQNVTLSAEGVDNSGTLQALDSLNLTVSSLVNKGELVALGDLTTTVSNGIDNQSLISAGKNANLYSNTLHNTSDIVAGQDLLIAKNAAKQQSASVTNKGKTHSGGRLAINANTLEQQGSMASVGDLNIDATSIDIQGDIGTQGDLTLSASSVINQAQVIAGQDLTLSSHGLSNHGTLTASGDVSVSLTNDFTHGLSGTISGHNVSLSAAQLNNSGTLQALNSLSLTVDALVNKGGLVALGDLTTTVSNGINNQSLIYAGNNANLYSNTLHNTSDIVVGNDLLIAKNGAKQKSASVTNSSGTIESLGGNIGIYTNSLTNTRTIIDVESTTTEDKRAQYSGVYNTVGTEHEPDVIEHEYCTDGGNEQSSGNHCRTSYSIALEDQSFTVTAYREGSQLKSASAASRIVAQGDIIIGAGTVLNRASQIAGDNVIIAAGTLTNQGYLFDEYTTYYDYTLGSDWTIRHLPFTQISERRVKTGSSGQLNSSITAGNHLTLNVANKVNNATIKANTTAIEPTGSAPELKANATAIEPTGSTSELKVTSSASVTGPTITFVDRNDIAFPDYIFPTAPNGLFILSPDPKGKYLIETNPLLTNMGNFLGSDYFMSSVGFNPEADVKFLGDAFYDSRIISQAIFEQTGKQYLNASVGSQLDQMQQLMDAAASQKVSLNLTAGIALSSSQVASLTQNIIWYEEIEVNGQAVLAPKLYLAQATIDNLSSGAQIAGSNVTIDAGDLANSGQLSADSSLSVNSSNSITNIGGTIASGGNVSLTAEKDIINLSGDIKGHDVSLEATNGSIINETRVTTSTASLGNNRGTFTDVGKTAAITSTGNLVLSAGKNIENHAADIKANGDANLNAGQDIIVSSKEETHGYDVTARGWREGESETSQIGANVTTGGNLTMSAGQNIAVTASQVTSGESLSLTAGNDITVQTALNKQSDHTYRSNYTEINRSEQHQGSMLEGKNVSLQAQNDITLSGSTVAAEQTANLKAKGDVNILAVNDSEYHYDKTVSKKSFGRSKTTINETYQEQVKGSAITAGNDISIKAQNLDSAITAGGDSNINVIGSSLNAGGEVSLSADGDVTLAAQTYKEFERHETIKKGFGGLSGSHKGNIDDATLLNSSYLINSGNTTIQAGNDIGVIASEVSSGGEVNLNAVNNVLVAAGEVLKQSQEWDEKTSFLSGGNLFEMEKKREGQQSSTAQSSVIQSGGNLSVNGGSVTVIGSELQADKNIELTADTGDVSILAAKENTHSFSSEEKLSVSLGDGFNGVSVDDGQVKISLGDATYDKVKQQSDALNHKGSVIAAGDNLSVNAESSILVEGSTLVADSNQDQSGDLTLAAKENVTIKEAVDTLSEQREEIHGKAEASLVVQHQAVEVAKAAQALQQSTKKLKQAEQDYKQYKKGLDSLESTLSTLEQEYADKKPGVTFEDIEELNDLISEVKSDEAWYVAGVALAAEDVASKTTLLVQQTAAAAQSSGTYGFNAGLHLDIEASQTESSSLTTTSVGSVLSGQNIKISAGNNTGNQLNIQGSELAANDTLSLAANEVNITASQDTHSSKSETQSGKIGASMTVYGASSGINLNASFDRSQSTSSSKTHNNSQLSADNISITSAQDTNIKGAAVDAEESLTLGVGGDLNVASVQDRYSSSNKGQGINGGLSLSGGSDAGQLTGGSAGINASNGRTSSKETVVTSLTSNGSLDINVGGNTDIKGATIAALDEEDKDSGKLNLTTDSLTYADLSNTRYSQDQSLGLNSSVGVNNGELDSTNNSTSLQYKNTSGYDKSKTLATIGQGNINIGDLESSDDTSRLNRDIDKAEKDLFTVDRKQGDIDVTIDHRLLTEEGRAQIKEDVKRTHLAGNAIADVVTDESVEVSDTFEHMDVLQKELDIQKKIALENPEVAQILNNLDLANAEAKQYAAEVYLQTYADVMGITIDEARVVAFEGGAKGNHLVQNGKTTVELNDAETTNGADAANTIVHEGTHAAISQGRIGDKGEFEEQYTGLVGNYAEDSFKFVLDNYGLGEYKSGDVNQHIGNDSSPLIWLNNINSVIQRNTPGVTVDNRFLSKREYELANTLAAESNGKYTAEEIRNVMRHTKAQESEKYDVGVSPYVVDTSKVNEKSFVDNSDGKLSVGQDGTGRGRYIVQDMGAIPLDDSAKQYLLDKDLGYSFFKIPETNKIVIDYLTGRPIDPASGTYIRPQTVDGKTFAVSYYPCATAECAATNSNMVKNEVSDAFINATSAKALDDASSLGNGVLLITPQGHAIKKSVEGLSLVAGAVEAKLKDEIGKEVINSLIQNVVGKRMAKKLGDNIGDKANVILDEVGVYEAIVEPIPEDSSIGGDKK